MTREEAKEIIISEKSRELHTYGKTKFVEALDVAIEALEQEPCGDAISRQAVIGIIQNWLNSDTGYSCGEKNVMKCTIDELRNLPSVNTKKTGRWIAQDIHNCHTNFKCSECGYIHNFMHLYGEPTADYTYCPNCGAKMGVEE